MQKRSMEMRSPDRSRKAFDRGADWASPVSSKLQESSQVNTNNNYRNNNNPFRDEIKHSELSQSIDPSMHDQIPHHQRGQTADS